MLSMALSREFVDPVDRSLKIYRRFLGRCAIFVVLTGLAVTVQAQTAAVDTDHDGLSDAMEQGLLERFVPRYHLSAGECDGRPALFAEGVEKATALQRDGTIYGQVTPRGRNDHGEALVEVHFYDLWGKDCGRKGHALDAEHVSVLLTAPRVDAPASAWRAMYWFAAAHEATMCDMSQVASGASLGAETRGPEMWISAGKHAAYLTEAICNGGCGADRCERSRAMMVARVVNLGEPGAAMHGATWVADGRWPLRAKMETDFPPAAMGRLERQELGEPALSNGAHGSVRGTIYVANATYGGLATSAENTAGALGTADDQTTGALATSTGKTVHALGKSVRRVGGALGKTVRAVVPGERTPTTVNSQ